MAMVEDARSSGAWRARMAADAQGEPRVLARCREHAAAAGIEELAEIEDEPPAPSVMAEKRRSYQLRVTACRWKKTTGKGRNGRRAHQEDMVVVQQRSLTRWTCTATTET